MTVWMKTRIVACVIVGAAGAGFYYFTHGSIGMSALIGLAGAIGMYIAMTFRSR
jgi:hypothetical protein